MSRFAAIVLTLWAGSLWTVCGLVAPSLFALLDDRHLAGQLAGWFFRIETAIGVVAGLALFVIAWRGKGGLSGRTTQVLIAVTALAPLASSLSLGPLMDRARAANDTAQFGMLHGVASVLFFVACATALALVWRHARADRG